MTLDPVHFDGIARLARRIDHDVDDSDHRDFAETVWNDFLDPLRRDGRPVLEPLDDLRRRCVDAEQVALQEDPFPTAHGVDSGTINPRTFRNGLVLDIAQAAMSASPSDLDLHRSRTVVATVHSNDATVRTGDDEWVKFDAGYSKGRIVEIPRVNRYEDAVVHALSLYLAESRHALDHADAVTDLLVLDGPVYPKAMLNWLDLDAELAELVATEETPRTVLENYVRLVEEFVGRDVPLVGFVKNPSSRSLVDIVRGKTNAPWAHDAAFFSQVLERGEFVDGEFERRTDELAFTNWFVSRLGPDAAFADGDELELDRNLAPESYEVCFFVVYDPRDDIVYKVEAPRAFAEDAALRRRIERQVLKEVAADRGPPLAIEKADALARIGANERRSLVDTLEATFESREDRTYDDKRWGLDY